MKAHALLAGLALAGCTAEQIEASPDPSPQPPELRRLSQTQYEHAIRDLFGDDVYVPPDLERELRLSGLNAIGSAEVSVSPRGVERYEAASYTVAEQVMDPERREALVPCEPSGTDDAACARTFLEQTGLRAWRRPLSSDELDALVEVSMGAAGTLDDFYDGLAFGLAALLQSPDFLMRPEFGEPDPEGGRRYTDYEMATRLSFLLWDTIPDEALLEAAAAGELTTTEGIDAQVQRMLEDARIHDGLRAWTTDVLHLDELDGIQKDPSVFLYMSEDFADAAREETVRTVDHLVLGADTDFRQLMTTRTTFVDRTLAALYDVQAPSRDGFGRVSLPADGPRAGLFGQASFLSLNAHPSSTSATLRGKFVRTVLLCEPLLPPPAGVDTSIPEPSPDAPTLRDRIAVHLESPACAGCHEQMDPIGLGLEKFDGHGRFRTKEAGVQIDPSGDLDDVPFQSALDLAQAVRDHEHFVPCMTEQVTRYALGREVADGEEAAFDWLVERFRFYDHRIMPLWMELAVHPMFRRVGEVE